jgi:ribosome-associated protein
MKKNKVQDSGETAKLIAGLLDAKKAEAIKILDVRKMSNLWDYFVVCSGLSTVHVRTLYDNIDDEMAKLGHRAAHRDVGHENKWIILDYGDILVHIFDAESRQHYSIEKMWGEKDAPVSKFLKRAEKAVKMVKAAKAMKKAKAKKQKVKNVKKRKK